MSKSKVTVTKVARPSCIIEHIVVCGNQQTGFISYDEAEAYAIYLAGFNDNPILIIMNTREANAIVQGAKK